MSLEMQSLEMQDRAEQWVKDKEAEMAATVSAANAITLSKMGFAIQILALATDHVSDALKKTAEAFLTAHLSVSN